MIRVKPEKLAEYIELHANPWPEVVDMIRECNIRNYSIFHKDGWLFAYFEYVGEDFEADMQKMHRIEKLIGNEVPKAALPEELGHGPEWKLRPSTPRSHSRKKGGLRKGPKKSSSWSGKRREKKPQ